MKTWDEWFTDLHDLIDPTEPGKLDDVRQFLELSERCRTQLGLLHNDLRAHILDELWMAALRLIYLDLLAAETHWRTAAVLHGLWQRSAKGTDEQRLVA